ncbi:type-1 angiotensin II receptor-like [Hyla sarda]|uniref:type-1 angiotensin II receptor-like n=1 Tax=Hyla sarda TaxID=327740 RepID=UPI0024C2F0E1|nr:type-1 angiotensin II receptor-like [Hyla sarda]
MDLLSSNTSTGSLQVIFQTPSAAGQTNCSHLKNDASYHFVLIPILYMCISIIGIVGNMIIVVGLTCLHKKSVANIYIVNLAIADLLFVATLPLWAVDLLGRYKWIFGSMMCKFCAAMSSVNMYASIFLLTGLSIDRYFGIVRPMKSLKKRTLTKAKISTLLIWGSAFVISTPSIYFRQTYYSYHSHHIVCGMRYPPNSLFWPVFVGSLKCVVGFLIPFIIQGICYYMIFKNILKSAKSKLRKTKSDKILTVVVSMVLAFLISWLPLHIVNILKLLARFGIITNCGVAHNLSILIPFTTCVAFSNSCVNPILYYFASNRFRSQFIKSIKGSLNRA